MSEDVSGEIGQKPSSREKTSSSGAMEPSSPEVSERMSKVRNKDTAAEMAIRTELHGRGFRYRVNLRLPEAGRTRPDIAFIKQRVAVFVDGCFWHKCPEHATFPKSNEQWWADKLDTNVRRDRTIDTALRKSGWTVVRIWEHEAPEEAVDKIVAALNRSTRSAIEG